MRGLPKDAIPAIDRPVFVKGAEAPLMRHDEYVIGISDGRVARAYSTWHLNGHEIVNDTLGATPIAVTWCPLCFTGIVYSRQVAGRTLTFGVSGMLWRENLVMYDRETDSWWAQASGEAIRGALRGARLTQLPTAMMTWKEWLARYPDTLVLSKAAPQGPEGRTDAYARYHETEALGVTGRARARTVLDPKMRVAGFRLNGRAFTIRLDDFGSARVIISRTAGETIIAGATTDRSGVRIFRAGKHVFAVRPEHGQIRLIDAASTSTWDPVEGRATAFLTRRASPVTLRRRLRLIG